MKLLILVLLSSSLVHADNYFPLEKQNADTTYADQGTCEKVEQSACYRIDECPSDECMIEVRKVEECDLSPDVKEPVCSIVEKKFVVPDPAKVQAKADVLKAVKEAEAARDLKVEEMKVLQKLPVLDKAQSDAALKFLLDETIH